MGDQIARFLPNNQYQAALSANMPSGANPFATITDTLYGGDGTLSGNRIVTGGGNNLTFNGLGTFSVVSGGASFSLSALPGNWSLSGGGIGTISANNNVNIISSSANVTLQGLNYPNSDGSANFVMKTDGSGNLSFVDIATLVPASTNIYTNNGTVGSGRVATLTDTLIINKGSYNAIFGSSLGLLDLEVPVGSTIPIAFYENRVGGANVGDSMSIGWSYNDSGGIRRVSSSSILSRVVSIGAGTVDTTLTLANLLQVRSGFGALLSQNASTDAPIAFFEIDNDAGSPYASSFLVTGRDDLAGSNMINLRNRSQNSALIVAGTLKSTFNNNQIATADVQIKGSTDVNLFYADAGLNKVGIDHLPTGASSKLTVDGGDIEVLGQNDGIILKDRTSGARYRVYIDATGVLHTEAA